MCCLQLVPSLLAKNSGSGNPKHLFNEPCFIGCLRGHSTQETVLSRMNNEIYGEFVSQLPLKFSTQSGKEIRIIEMISKFFKDVEETTKMKLDDKLLVEIEGIVALLLALEGCSTYISMCSAIFLYVRQHCDSSISGQILEYVDNLFTESQAGFEFDDDDSPAWLRLLRTARENWTLCKDNQLFTHFSKLLGLLVTAGLCKATDVTFSLNEYKVWEPDLSMVHGSAFDIADAAFSTVIFFVESMYESFRQGSLKPMLINDKTAAEIDEEYAKIVLWWDLVKNGNLKRVANIPESRFDAGLETLTTKIRNLLHNRKGFEKKLLNDKFMKLLGIRNDYTTLKISSGVRKAPFAIELFGESSQGKTTCGDQIVDALLMSANLPMGKEYRASYNAADKFMSNWSTNKEVLFIDDMANDKSSFVEKPPTRVIIDVCNNQPFYANMADLERKGKVFVEPSLVVVNTNVKNLDAGTYSNCPYSIQRRMHAVITVKAKEEFQFLIDGKPQGIDPAKVRAKYANTENKPVFDDIWELTVSKAVQPANMKHIATYTPVSYRGQPMDGVPMRLVLQYLIEQFDNHRKDQEDILARMVSRDGKMNICPFKNCCQIQGYCDAHDHLPQPHFGEELIPAWHKATNIIGGKLHSDTLSIDKSLDKVASVGLLFVAKRFAKHWDWVKLIPTPWFSNRLFLTCMMACDYPKIRSMYINWSLGMWSTLIGSSAYIHQTQKNTNLTCFVTGFSLMLGLCGQKMMAGTVEQAYRRQLVDRSTIQPMLQQWKNENMSRVFKAAGVVGILVAAAKLYKNWKMYDNQGSLEPTTASEIKRRDEEDSPWVQVTRRELPMTHEAKSLDQDRLENIVKKNLVYGSICVNGKTLMANALFLTSNVVVLPSHYFEDDSLDVTFRKRSPEKCGGKFATRLCKASSVRIPFTDLMLCYSPNGGSFKDITKYLPTDVMPKSEFKMIWRRKNGEIISYKGLTQPGRVSNGVCNFDGGTYINMDGNTFKGMCGAVAMSKGIGSVILGLHLGGVSDTPRGCYGSLTQSQAFYGMEQLRTLEGVVLSGSAEQFEQQVLGVNILQTGDLHTKSPLNYLPKHAQFEYYGRCGGQTSSHSDVKETVISKHVERVMGFPNVYCAPAMQPEWFGWQNCLEGAALPAHPYPHKLLTLAITDYKRDLLPIARKLWSKESPLLDHENMCGVPGLKFLDPIKLDTSIGYPLKGEKRKFVVDLEPTPDIPNNKEFIPEIKEEIQRCEDCYKRGERAYTIAKACKKDEVLAKRKCRIFYGNPIALTWLVRKYYLPVLRMLQMHPLVSECAVGINSHGPEWEELHNFVFTHGEDRLIGGDYGKYDQKIPSQLLFASLRILIDLTREMDYTDEDRKVMESMTGDVVYALIAVNGDLIGLTEGTHISGNSLTVILNGICGSLSLRSYFFHKNPPSLLGGCKRFRDYVSVMTYGDDNIGSVSSKIQNFTIKGISEFLGEYGQIYTMPDKNSELIDFLPPEEFEFLKRKSIYCPEKGVRVGALIDKSIFKMLHMYLRPKGCVQSPQMASAENIDTALREWANHGRDVYEKRRAEMAKVAEAAGLSHLVTRTSVSYDECVKEWRLKYLKSDALARLNAKRWEIVHENGGRPLWG